MAGFPKQHKAKRPKPGIILDKDTIARLIPECSGNVSRVADRMGASRGAVRNVIDRYPDLTELLRQARERLIDDLEESVFQRAVDSSDTALQAFVLKTQGRHRGWDQNECQNAARDIATAAFDFIVNKSKNPVNTPQQNLVIPS